MAEDGAIELTPAQRRAIAALLTERDIRAAATEARVGERSLHRWLKLPAFCAAAAPCKAHTRARGEQAAQLEQITRRLSHAAGAALDALERGLQAEEPMALQLRAADIVIGRMLKARELLELELRLTALEQQTIQIEYVNNWRGGYSAAQGADDEA